MDDNIRYPKQQFEAKVELIQLLKVIIQTKEIYKAKELVKTLEGKKNAVIQSHKTDSLEIFGSGSSKDSNFWMAIIRQALVTGYLVKEIESYGLIRITARGKAFLNQPSSFMMTEDHKYDQDDVAQVLQNKPQGILDLSLIHI